YCRSGQGEGGPAGRECPGDRHRDEAGGHRDPNAAPGGAIAERPRPDAHQPGDAPADASLVSPHQPSDLALATNALAPEVDDGAVDVPVRGQIESAPDREPEPPRALGRPRVVRPAANGPEGARPGGLLPGVRCPGRCLPHMSRTSTTTPR